MSKKKKIIMRPCSFEGCGKPYEALGYCHTHYCRLKAHGDASISLRPTVDKTLPCSVKSCDRKRLVKDLCSRHYQRLRTHKDVNVNNKEGRSICTVHDCSSYVEGWGLCIKHYKRVRRGNNVNYAPRDVDMKLFNKGLLKCFRCNSIKPFKNFSPCKKAKIGYRRVCKECLCEATIIRKFGITPANYRAMQEKQQFCCAICKIHQSKLKKRLNIDHCHKTGLVRALLCSKCNTGLGSFKDSPDLLEIAIKYLKDFKDAT